MARKLYIGPIVNVSFDADICQHAAECLRGMQEVYDTSKRPWIDADYANTPELADKLRDVTRRCPSGALRLHERGLADDEQATGPGNSR